MVLCIETIDDLKTLFTLKVARDALQPLTVCALRIDRGNLWQRRVWRGGFHMYKTLA